MNSIGLDKKTPRKSRRSDAVAKGESTEISGDCVSIARLAPTTTANREGLRKFAQEIRVLRKGNRLRGLSIHELIEEGRRSFHHRGHRGHCGVLCDPLRSLLRKFRSAPRHPARSGW